ncbi:6-phosphofructokinase [Aminithiophilus ramosus]|uniref:ATP-dependent 6-phosphofructokinase n=1 Tax=Aminithiophilus ramosus TaxID=3029084 RepID=A0A9Q7ABN4_9BACT|nr:6-phosphofructokinase [Aminithiophilus ramosus]QTX31604.1 6-phosphofructokinase [Aminithiophilus ramosus]
MKRIAVLTSGGDAPAMNAAVRSVARSAIFRDIEVVGVRRGYEGLLEGDLIPLTKSSVGGIIHRGGTILRTARSERFRRPEGINEALQQLKRFDIDGLVVVGGDGSFRGAWELVQRGFAVVGVPATIDNDIAGTDMTIGFDTALNTVLEAVKKIRDTASSHDRLFIIEVMGREAGFLALEVAVASGAEYVLVPERPVDLPRLCDKLHYARKRGKTHSLIVLAEGVMAAHELAGQLLDTGGYDSRITVLGHIQRGGSPSAFDAVLASRMGAAALTGLVEGQTGVMAAYRRGGMELVPLSLAWEQKKELNTELLDLVEKLSI